MVLLFHCFQNTKKTHQNQAHNEERTTGNWFWM